MFKKWIIGCGSIVATTALPIVAAVSCHEGDTQCNDDSFSDAKGRGACSHHQGVRTWNYQPSRIYT